MRTTKCYDLVKFTIQVYLYVNRVLSLCVAYPPCAHSPSLHPQPSSLKMFDSELWKSIKLSLTWGINQQNWARYGEDIGKNVVMFWNLSVNRVQSLCTASVLPASVLPSTPDQCHSNMCYLLMYRSNVLKFGALKGYQICFKMKYKSLKLDLALQRYE